MPHSLKYKQQIKKIVKNKDGTYKIIYSRKSEGVNGYIGYEVDWKVVPRYKPDGSLKTPEEFQNEIIRKYGEVYWNQNYGGEFIGSSHTLLSSNTLKMLKNKEPVNTYAPGLKIFIKPEKHHHYIMAVDAAKDGSDSFAVQVIDITNFNFRQVATAKLDVDYLIMPEILEEWAQMYNNAFLIIENNEGAGQSVADQMYLTYEYENLYFDKDTKNKNKKYPGFRTTPKSRKLILKTMKTFIENNNLEINCQDTIDEFFTFILDNGKYQADDSSHDDMIMSLAIVFAPFCNSKNFVDMEKIVGKIFNNHEDSEDVEISDILVIGDFDDTVDDNFEKSVDSYDSYDSIEEYYGSSGGFM
jgi:hypothetical protein